MGDETVSVVKGGTEMVDYRKGNGERIFGEN